MMHKRTRAENERSPTSPPRASVAASELCEPEPVYGGPKLYRINQKVHVDSEGTGIALNISTEPIIMFNLLASLIDGVCQPD
jgi:hypothetical protein